MAKYVSKVSGKCCLEDTIEMWTKFEDEKIKDFLNRTKFYLNIKVYGSTICPDNEIKITNYKELVPYLPRCESFMSMSKSDKNIIILSGRPHWAFEETELKEQIFKDILRVYNKCKRKKIEFTKEYLEKESYYFGHDFYKDICDPIYERFVKLGKKATLADIHSNSKNLLYREPFMKEMLAVGYTQDQAYNWVYNEIKTW